MLLFITALISGLALLLWSADRFVEGSVSLAKNLNVSPLMIGMVIIGFGTSAPELVVSVLASLNGSPGIALGNAYGSNIANIAVILGITALISPIVIHSSVLRRELPILLTVTALSIFLVVDLNLSRLDAIILLILFILFIGGMIGEALKKDKDSLTEDYKTEPAEQVAPTRFAIQTLVFGLVLLIVSSRVVVGSAVEIAQIFGISDMVIGLTIVAIGTSLPELASSVAAARKNAHEIAVGNIIGSNLFNSLMVVGLSGLIGPTVVSQQTLMRDMTVMGLLTVLLFIFALRFKGKEGGINRSQGFFLLLIYALYIAYIIYGAI